MFYFLFSNFYKETYVKKPVSYTTSNQYVIETRKSNKPEKKVQKWLNWITRWKYIYCIIQINFVSFYCRRRMVLHPKSQERRMDMQTTPSRKPMVPPVHLLADYLLSKHLASYQPSQILMNLRRKLKLNMRIAMVDKKYETLTFPMIHLWGTEPLSLIKPNHDALARQHKFVLPYNLKYWSNYHRGNTILIISVSLQSLLHTAFTLHSQCFENQLG